MDFIFDEKIIKKAAQNALAKNTNIVDSQAQQAFLAGFEQAVMFTEKKVACHLEYENLSGTSIVNYSQEETWKISATRKTWDFLYEDKKEWYDELETDFKEQIIDRILFRKPDCDTQENLILLSIDELEAVYEKIWEK